MTNRVRGRLASSRRKVKGPSVEPRLGNNAPPLIVRETGEALPKRALRGTVSLVVAAVLTVGLFYVVLAATVAGIFGAGNLHAVVLRGAFPEGSAPVGSFVYGSASPAAHDAANRLLQAVQGVPAGSVLQIIAPPDTRVANGPHGTILSDGKPTGFTGAIKPRLLTHVYLASCVSGGCGKPGDPVILPIGNVIGGVKAYIGLSGIHAPTARP